MSHTHTMIYIIPQTKAVSNADIIADTTYKRMDTLRNESHHKAVNQVAQTMIFIIPQTKAVSNADVLIADTKVTQATKEATYL